MDMQKLTSRLNDLAEGIAEANLELTRQQTETVQQVYRESQEVANESLRLAAQVVRAQQRLSAFGAVLESLGAQKAALYDRLHAASTPAIEQMCLGLIQDLTGTELEILSQIGIPQETAVKAIGTADGKKLYERSGKRFVPITAGSNGNGNGHHDDN